MFWNVSPSKSKDTVPYKVPASMASFCSSVPPLPTDQSWDAAATALDGDVCLSLRVDALHWFGVELIGGRVRARAVSAPFDQVLGETELPQGGRLGIRARPTIAEHVNGLGPDTIELGVEHADGTWAALASLDGRHLSTEVAAGFTGRMLALESLESLDRQARLGSFEYRTAPSKEV